MLKDCDWSLDRDYKTGSENEPLQFYLDGLANSSEFSLLLGYFSSSAINFLSVGFATFISKGGNMKMVINHLLSSKDKEAIVKANEENTNKIFDLTDIVSLERVLDEYDTHFFECLTYLISEKRIEIKIIKPKYGRGIAHYKSGVFSDGQDSVGYKASCNFTLYGLSENLEELEAFLSWENGRSNKLIKNQLMIIDDYLTEKDEDVEYVPVNEIEVVLKDRFGGKDIKELLVQEEQLLKKKMSLMSNPKLKKTITGLLENIETIRKTPKFPYPSGPRPYQNEAFENWKNNNQKGIFAMATGTGKTITSLNCLLEIYYRLGYYKAIILVPTITLVNQWEDECKNFNFSNIIKIYSRGEWKDQLSRIITEERFSSNNESSYIIISTYASYVRPNIFSEINQLSKRALLIADEAHNMGADSLIKLLPKIKQERRIGLSATPERQYDEEGNKKIKSFFNNNEGYSFEYSMKEAIENGVLSRYFYYPHIVRLTENEMQEYIKVSKQIAKFYNFSNEQFNSDSILTALLLKRKRIIHKAQNKQIAYTHILQTHFEKTGNLKYTFVYVPEGNESDDYHESDIFIKSDSLKENEESIRLIDLYTKIVREIDDKVTVSSFIASSSNKEELLELFSRGALNVLTSMKCLDEGVDVPRAELAVFCASTGNPRQFIQRRGRILRKHKDKKYAIIHDLVVVPEISPGSDSYKLERNLFKAELKRVNNFAELSENSSYTVNVLFDVMNYYNLNLYNNE